MMHNLQVTYAGKKLQEAGKALIMIHGRGASSADILSLAAHLDVNDFALIAPQATNHSWYPYSFMTPIQSNEPWLGSAISLLKQIVSEVTNAGITNDNLFFLGFSQGACLTLEYVTRHARKYGGVIAFTGGLIGETLNRSLYKGDFAGTPVFIGSSDPDPHVPVNRVKETTAILKEMNADVVEKIYPGMGHTINQDEINRANNILLKGKVIQ